MLQRDTLLKKKYRKLFVAGLLGWVVAIVGEMADSILAGLLISEEAVSAVELVLPIGSLAYAVGLPVGYGCAMLYSKVMGSFDKEHAYQIAFQGIVTALAIGTLAALALFILREPMLDFYGASDSIRVMAREYYTIYIAIIFMTPPFWAVYNLILFDGDEVLTLTTDIAMALLNAVVSFFLGRKLGVRGFALGTVVSYVVPFFILLIHFAKKNNSIRFRKGFRFRELGQMVYLGSTSGMTYLYLGVLDIVMNRFVISRFGDAFLPAYAVVNLVLNLGGVLVCAYDGGRAFVTVAFGERNSYAIRRTMRIVIKTAIICAISMTVLFEFAAPYWYRVYSITGPEVITASIHASRVIPLTYVALALLYVYQAYYPCIEEVVLGNCLALCNMLVGPLVLAIPLALIGGFSGMNIGFALAPVFALLVGAVVEAVRGRGKDLTLLLPPSDEEAVSFDLRLESGFISEVCEKVRDYLSENKVEADISNQVQLMIEETLNRIIEKNPEQKVIADVTILVSPGRVRLITRDNGIIFDITETDSDIRNLRCYVLSQLMLKADEKTYATSISYNRNMYVWERAGA